MFLHGRWGHRMSRVFVSHTTSTPPFPPRHSSDLIHFILDLIESSRCPLRARQLVSSLTMQHHLRRIEFAFARVRCPSAFPQFHSKRCRTPSSARKKPLFTTDDRIRKSTMPFGFPPVTLKKLLSTLLCTNETTVYNG
jgi:hypothetical protein